MIIKNATNTTDFKIVEHSAKVSFVQLFFGDVTD
jgi:hypothetical protein